MLGEYCCVLGENGPRLFCGVGGLVMMGESLFSGCLQLLFGDGENGELLLTGD